MRFEPIAEWAELAARVPARLPDHPVVPGRPIRRFAREPALRGATGAEAIEDLYRRYWTMKGCSAPVMREWTGHGIATELRIEQQLGLSGRRQIERYGVAGFNRLCRASAPATMTPQDVEAVWGTLKQLYERGLLREEERVSPWCPRCGTALAGHELARSYEETEDLGLYVRFPLLTGPLAGQADLLIWTTMPWTLIPATLAVVGPGLAYVLATGGRAGDRPVVLAAGRVAPALGEGARVLREVPVCELEGARYRAPFGFVGPGSADDPDGDPSSWRFVVADGFVKPDEGTGIVHTGAAYGPDDMRVARRHGVPVVKPVGPDGRFDARTGPYAGLYIRDADDPITRHLRAAGLLVHSRAHRHAFPFCVYCRTPLHYAAAPGWHLGPDAGNGWTVSRERYWGTPLPLWRCGSCGHTIAIASRAELGALAGADLAGLDPHRPYVDEISFACASCGGAMTRVPGVTDAWYDAGARHARHPEPLDLACGSAAGCTPWTPSPAWCRDATVTGTPCAPGERAPRRRRAGLRRLPLGDVRRAGHRGQDTAHGVEHGGLLRHLRRPRRLDTRTATGRTVTGRTVTGRTVTGRTVTGRTVTGRTVMDRWVLARLAETCARADAALSGFDPAAAARCLALFTDDLSNWYVRRCRERFWAGRDEAAFATLHTCLVTLAGLLAPFAPCLAAELHEKLAFPPDPAEPDPARVTSPVHMTQYPRPDPGARDGELCSAMALARRLTSLGRDARAAAGIPARQPLRRATVTVPAAERARLIGLREVVEGELNVKAVEFGEPPGRRVTVKPDFRALGREFGSRTRDVAAAIAAADPERLLARLGRDGSVELRGFPVRRAHLQLAETPAAGWQLSADGPYAVAVDTSMDRGLRLEGLAREFTRLVNDLRKRQGSRPGEPVALAVEVVRDPDGELAAFLEDHRAAIARGAYADPLTIGSGPSHGPGEPELLALAGGQLHVRLSRTGARARP
ncbi:class I tRNA ligase family protein [Nonomuraea thailandensis]